MNAEKHGVEGKSNSGYTGNLAIEILLVEGETLENLIKRSGRLEEVRDRLVGLQASAYHDLPPWPMRVNSTQPAWRSRWCTMTA